MIEWFFFFKAEDGIRYDLVTGVQTCALPISRASSSSSVGAGICATTDELLDALVAFRRGEVRVERPPLLAINASAVDPTRAPAGKHTLKLVGFLPYHLRDGGPERWDSINQWVSNALFDHSLRHGHRL